MHWTVAPIEIGGASGPPHHRVATKTKKPSAKTAAIKPRFVERGLVASVLSSSIMSGLINFWIGEALPLQYQVLHPRRPLCLGNTRIKPFCQYTLILTLFAGILLSPNNEEGRTV